MSDMYVLHQGAPSLEMRTADVPHLHLQADVPQAGVSPDVIEALQEGIMLHCRCVTLLVRSASHSTGQPKLPM